MQAKSFFACFLICLILSGCAGMKSAEPVKPARLHLEGIVQEIRGQQLTIVIRLPEIAKGTAIDEIAREVIRKTTLLEGMRIVCDERTAVVKEVRGETARIEFESVPPFTSGAILRLDIPKKNLAIVDFEVIKGNQKDAGRVTLEGLTAALIDSGQFVVVEREKLKTILSELQLSLSGLASKTPDQVIGNLFIADLILTGTFAQIQDEWDVRLRIISVRTGQAIAAVSTRSKLFPASELRDAGAFAENFEGDVIDASWVQRRFGRKAGGRIYYEIFLDKTQGAEDSSNCVRIDFSTPGKMDRSMMLQLENRKKRDLSLFTGIEFWVKGTEELNAEFQIDCSQPDDQKRGMRWTGFFKIGVEWTKINIPFDKLVVARAWVQRQTAAKTFIPGDEILRLHRVEDFRIGIDARKNLDMQGSFWIDKIRTY
jgi:hypothetical protein